MMKTITNRHPRNDALAQLSPPSVVLQKGGRNFPRPLLYFRRAAAAMRSLKLDACLSSMQARRIIENTLSMKAEDGRLNQGDV